jgi:hypothetical protein
VKQILSTARAEDSPRSSGGDSGDPSGSHVELEDLLPVEACSPAREAGTPRRQPRELVEENDELLRRPPTVDLQRQRAERVAPARRSGQLVAIEEPRAERVGEVSQLAVR